MAVPKKEIGMLRKYLEREKITLFNKGKKRTEREERRYQNLIEVERSLSKKKK